MLRLFALVASWGILGPSWRPKLLFGLEKKKTDKRFKAIAKACLSKIERAIVGPPNAGRRW